MLLPPGGFKSQKNNSCTPCVPMLTIVDVTVEKDWVISGKLVILFSYQFLFLFIQLPGFNAFNSMCEISRPFWNITSAFGE